MIFAMVNGKRVLMAPEEGEDGSAAGGPAGEEAGSNDESEFEEIHEQFESSSYDEAEEGQDEESEAEEESDDTTAEDDVSSEESEEDETESETDESEDKEDDADDDKSEDTEEDDDEEEEPQPEPLTDEQIEEARQQYMEKIAEQFQISDEEADQLRTEPEKVMPKLLAKAMTQALEQSVSIMRNNLPKLVGSQLTQQNQAMETEQKFFGKYPELKTKKAMKVAEGIAKTYRQMNPDADLDEVMDTVAFMTWKRMGLPMDKLSERMNSSKSEEFVSSGKQKSQKAGFTPSNPGKTGATRKPASQQPQNEFEELASLMNDDSMFGE